MPGAEILFPREIRLMDKACVSIMQPFTVFAMMFFSLWLSQCKRAILVGLLWGQEAWERRSNQVLVKAKSSYP